MKNLSNLSLETAVAVQPEAESPRPLTPPRRLELWGGRLAMVGFLATTVAIVIDRSL